MGYGNCDCKQLQGILRDCSQKVGRYFWTKRKQLLLVDGVVTS